MQRKINFNAGPATLPEVVLQQAAAAVLEYNNSGISILELNHRGAEFADIVRECNDLVRELCGIGSDYEVMWLQGGGRMQFSMLPMNFLTEGATAGYIDSGYWAAEAQQYAAHYGQVQVLASSAADGYNRLPELPANLHAQLAYLHITTNNTIYGTQWHSIPATNVPLVADMSSDILSRQHDYNQYAMFYAAVQKNLGTPGLALVAIKKNMLEWAHTPLPPMLSYKAHAKEKSILNTANVYSQYVTLLMLRWIKSRGIATIEKDNRAKAEMLYAAIDNSTLFTAYVAEPTHRSLMNICFTAATPELEASFVSYCNNNNIVGIKGHRSVGGFRASVYNALSVETVAQLVETMKEFERMQ